MKRLWTRLLIALHIWRDWEHDTQFTPPAWPIAPHAYDNRTDREGNLLTCCAMCGGGPKHAIHAGDPMQFDVIKSGRAQYPAGVIKGCIEREH
jgi:hypothetical protein